ncbi:MAG: DUF192 domain-containing protein [Patescibacteria group bacterium]
MKKILLSFFLFIVFAAVAVIFLATKKNEQSPIREIIIGGHIFQVEIADDVFSRSQGLSNRESLEPDRGMLFIFEQPASQSFWMKNMKFPLDIIWIKNGKIIGLEKNVPPDASPMPRVYPSPSQVDQVLEINAGKADDLNMEIGEMVTLK